MNIRKLKNFIVNKIKSEIPDSLTYHGVHHTLEVLEACNKYVKRMKIPSKDAYLLRSAALLHDIGIMWNYHNHEEKAIEFNKATLPDWGYSTDDIKVINNLILATRIPQQPNTIIEQIICDSDLDYLGTDQFYSIGETLYQEFMTYKIVSSRKEWDRLQVHFLTGHHYHTPYAKKHREPIKWKYIEEIKQKWNWD